MQNGDILSRAAEAARIVVHLEIAYDVLDELASSPERYSEGFYKLSRLATKVYNDLQKATERHAYSQEVAESLRLALRRVSNWGDLMGELLKYLDSLDEKRRKEEIKRFAALAISPDRDLYRLLETLRQGKGESKREAG